MQIFDEVTARLSNLTAEAQNLPAQLDALRAAAAAGVKVPGNHVWADMAELDHALSTAFGPSKNNVDWERRVALKNQILAARLVGQPERPKQVEEGMLRRALNLLREYKIEFDGKHMFNMRDIEAAAEERKLSPKARIDLKRTLECAGLLDVTNTVVAKPPMVKPAAGVVERLCASLDLDTPRPGEKISVATLNRAMDSKGLNPERRIQIKATLSAAGVL